MSRTSGSGKTRYFDDPRLLPALRARLEGKAVERGVLHSGKERRGRFARFSFAKIFQFSNVCQNVWRAFFFCLFLGRVTRKRESGIL